MIKEENSSESESESEFQLINNRIPSLSIHSWIGARPPGYRLGQAFGKWLIFAHRTQIDEMWEIIKRETISGNLGCSAKVAGNGELIKKDQLKRIGKVTYPYSDTQHVICVYTGKDDNIMEVREKLRKLGFTEKLSYKTDEVTRAGKYSDKGDRNISSYHC